MIQLRTLAEDYKITLIMIHHSTKIDFESIMSLQNLAGSRVISQEFDYIYGLNRTFNNQKYLKLVSSRYDNDNIETVDVLKFNANLWFEVSYKEKEIKLLRGKVDGRANNENFDKVLDFIKSNSKDGLIQSATLKKGLVPNVMSEPTMHSQLNKLESQSLIKKLKHGEYSLVA